MELLWIRSGMDGGVDVDLRGGRGIGTKESR